MPAPTVFLVRHGNRIDFIDPEWTGPYRHDPHLAPDGVMQARQTARRLAREEIQAIYASPFWRALETAQPIAEELDLPIRVEPGASEWLNPRWFPVQPELRPTAAALKAFPRLINDHQPVEHPVWPETEDQAFARESRTIHALADLHDGPILVVGHGHSLLGMAQALVPGAEITHALCAIVRLDRGPNGWEMTLAGDTAHLESGEQAGHRLV